MEPASGLFPPERVDLRRSLHCATWLLVMSFLMQRTRRSTASGLSSWPWSGHEDVSLEDGELRRVGLDSHFALDLLCEEMFFFLSGREPSLEGAGRPTVFRVRRYAVFLVKLVLVCTSRCTCPFVVLCGTQETRSSLLTLFSHSGVTGGRPKCCLKKSWKVRDRH